MWGFVGTIVANVVVILVTIVMTITFWLRNKKADRGELIIEGIEGFRYTI